MSGLHVAIIAESGRQYRQLAGAIRGVGVEAIHDVAVEEAVRWLDLRPCDVCVLSHELPGKRTGLDLLLDIRKHCPDLPVVMVSRAGSDRVAVAAFHADVIDYVPISRGYEVAVASLIGQLKVTSRIDQILPAQIIPAGIDEALMRLTYQNRLRAVGRHLDLYGFRRIYILEVEGGFVVRATAADGRETETLEFADQHFPQLLASCAAARGEGERHWPVPGSLLPTGYEDFLRAVGYELDQRAAEAITISELDDLAVVSGVGRVDEYGVTRFGPLQWLLRRPDVERLLDEAYRRRAPVPAGSVARAGRGPAVLRRLTG
ncbi:MAG TPA: response regulator [Thermomicrobiales bacterium]|nr:response regulator [Thermomicrobiales bacterium]